MRKASVLGLTLALSALFAPSAFGTHDPVSTAHKDAPKDVPTFTPAAACTVDGQVTGLSVNGTPDHNSFVFSTTTIDCQNGQGDVFDQAFVVDAHGDTDGPDHDGDANTTADHGEDCGAGWSNDDYFISATGDDSTFVSGSGQFVRVGEAVTTWGSMSGDATVKYYSELKFTPTNPASAADQVAFCTQSTGIISAADLDGGAVVGA